MKLAYKLIVPTALVFILFFSILLSYIITTEKSIVSDFQNSVNYVAIEQFEKRKSEKLSTENDYLDFVAFLASKIAVEYVYNYETVNIELPLSKFLSLNSIEGIRVYDTIGKENFITLIKDKNGKSVKVDNVPAFFNAYKQFKKPMTKSTNSGVEENFGYIIIYYNENLVKQIIIEKQKIVLSILESIKNKIKEDMDVMIKNQTIFIMFIVVILSLFIFLMVQKFVLMPLSKLKKGIDGFFLFLQNKKDSSKKIELTSNDEFGQMANSLNENISVSARLHEEIYELNTNLENRVNEKTKKVTTLLDNAGQGFLSFDSKFVIDDEYSKECLKLFGCDISGEDITELLFCDDIQKNFFKKTLKNTLSVTDDFVQDSLLSLLPSSITLNRRALKLEYKIVDNDKFMLVITNITSQKKLEKKIRKEQDILKMIVSVVSESDTFYELKNDYSGFINSCEIVIDMSKTPLFNLSEIYRTIHTFKGTFSQLYMKNSVEFLHNLESEISKMIKENCDCNEELKELLMQSNFNESLEKDFDVIKDILGEEFFNSVNFIKIDLNDIQSLQKKISHLLEQKESLSKPCKEVLCQVQSLTSQKLVMLLKPYIKLSQQLACRLEKEIYEFDIIGEKELVVPVEFKPFIKALIHVFRNSIDHGVEDPETRVLKGKDEKGTIACNFAVKDDCLQLMISDDGAGIDCEKIKHKLSHKDINLDGLTRSEIFNLIFNDNFTTKDEISNISGRGVGMSSIKIELENLNGRYEIQSKEDVGTTFVFKLPLKKEQYNKNLKLKDYMLEPLLNRTISFLRDDLKIKVINENFDILSPKTIELNENSAVIGTNGSISNNIAISYDDTLLNKIAELFFESESSDDEKIEGVAQNVSAEVLNIIVGNALSNPLDNSVLSITPPLLVKEKKILNEHENSEVAMAILKTEFGNMILYVFGPKELFEYEFKGL